MDGKKARIFISYSWSDIAAAKEIENALIGDPLIAGQLSVWRDQSAMKPGDHISDSIVSGLTNADFFVLLVSESSSSSAWVKREVDMAAGLADKKKLTAIPFLLGNAEVPFPFRGLLYIDGRPSLGAAIQKLLEFFRSQLELISVLEPREMFRKSMDDNVRQWRTCQDKLRALEVRQLRYHLTDKLTLGDIKVLWFDVFGRKMDDEVPAQNLAGCCVELLDRSRREGAIVELIDLICRNHPRVSAAL